ncbi:X8 domain-containing protein [Artemisia annua]|uniref:X8 domain-containing protein n=1 Tax=Artemisia annua TaxID=35608 RepID=A0A2U1M5J9_ARTAN|nr:X8 domain-containing protein [Artemisia annua]
MRNASVGRGQSMCIANNRASQEALQSTLDYAYGFGGSDCVTLQHGSNYPAALKNHASYTFNSYSKRTRSQPAVILEELL